MALFELEGQGKTKVSLNIQEVFHIYLNKFEIAISHLFLIIFSYNLHWLICSPGMGSHQENRS